jgi:hypothetical protein
VWECGFFCVLPRLVLFLKEQVGLQRGQVDHGGGFVETVSMDHFCALSLKAAFSYLHII